MSAELKTPSTPNQQSTVSVARPSHVPTSATRSATAAPLAVTVPVIHAPSPPAVEPFAQSVVTVVGAGSSTSDHSPEAIASVLKSTIAESMQPSGSPSKLQIGIVMGNASKLFAFITGWI